LTTFFSVVIKPGLVRLIPPFDPQEGISPVEFVLNRPEQFQFAGAWELNIYFHNKYIFDKIQ